MIGITSGLIVVIYRAMMMIAENLRGQIFEWNAGKWPWPIILFALICGLGMAWVNQRFPDGKSSGVPMVLAEIQGRYDMNARDVTFGKYIGGLLIGLTGCSLGIEGPSIQLGGALGKLTGHRVHPSSETPWRVSVGAATGMAAAFGAPLTGLIFALEELERPRNLMMILPYAIASTLGAAMSWIFYGTKYMFPFALGDKIPTKAIGYFVILAVVAGLVGAFFTLCTLMAGKLYRTLCVPPTVQLVFVTVITMLVGLISYESLGGGHHLLMEAPNFPQSITLVLSLLVGKILLTTFTSGAKAPGGVFVPVLAVGGLIGALLAQILVDQHLITADLTVYFVILGMAAAISGVMRSPFLAIAMVAEITGAYRLILLLVMVSFIAYYVANATKTMSLYETLLSKSTVLKPQKKES